MYYPEIPAEKAVKIAPEFPYQDENFLCQDKNKHLLTVLFILYKKFTKEFTEGNLGTFTKTELKSVGRRGRAPRR